MSSKVRIFHQYENEVREKNDVILKKETEISVLRDRLNNMEEQVFYFQIKFIFFSRVYLYLRMHFSGY